MRLRNFVKLSVRSKLSLKFINFRIRNVSSIKFTCSQRELMLYYARILANSSNEICVVKIEFPSGTIQYLNEVVCFVG